MSISVNYAELLEDSRPELQDSRLWCRLFRLIPTMPDLTKAEVLQRRLWQLRSIGATIRNTHIQTKILPLISPDGDWENEEEYEDVKAKYLSPYAQEIKWLLNQL